ncbi:MAG: transcription antitermination factor NusB [Alphaproteobacteria bacterium]|nr:transcription antitermination factor NusB [Alphaproteobacteria bacterium]
MSKKPAKRVITPAQRRRSAARLAAVQVLYQIDMSGASADEVLRDVLQRGGMAVAAAAAVADEDGREPPETMIEPDGELLTFLVRETLDERERFDEVIGASLSRDWPAERLEAVLRAILRAGACEMIRRPAVPPRVVISEWVDVAHAFYAGHEPGMVNAVLDRIARVVRPEEMGGENGRP